MASQVPAKNCATGTLRFIEADLKNHYSMNSQAQQHAHARHSAPAFVRGFFYPPLRPPPSCAPAWRHRQGQALRVLRNLDAAGRGRR